MVESKDLLKGINAEDLSASPSRATGTYMLFSFDLVNSTTFKTKNSDWPMIFDGFYSQCEKHVFSQIERSQLWKRVGDEVLFYCPLMSQAEIPDYIQAAYEVTEECIVWLNETTKDRDRTLSVKATVWAAFVEDAAPQHAQNEASPKKRNYVIKPKSIHDAEIDFLGPDIDIGFRIAKFAVPGKLVVDAKLALLASRQVAQCGKPAVADSMRVVSFETLKGVWDGRRYPIVWFHKSWANVSDMFLYDEPHESAIVRELDKTDGKAAKHVPYIEKVLSDLNKASELTELENGIELFVQNNPNGLARRDIPRDRLCEIHLVCVCVNPENKVMIGKRPSTKRLFPNLWEFGCTQLNMNAEIGELLVEYYKKEFGLTIRHPAGKPYPIGTYSFVIPGEDRTIPGIVFVALANKKAFRRGNFNDKKHTDVKWVSLKEAKAIKQVECVEGFIERIELALRVARRVR